MLVQLHSCILIPQAEGRHKEGRRVAYLQACQSGAMSPRTRCADPSRLWSRCHRAGDALVVPKQTGEQGFYKVWVSDAPIEAE